jgi:hypothetical protein
MTSSAPLATRYEWPVKYSEQLSHLKIKVPASRFVRKERATTYDAKQRIVSALRYPALHRRDGRSGVSSHKRDDKKSISGGTLDNGSMRIRRGIKFLEK